MRRRRFSALMACAAAISPRARAQQAATQVVGWLGGRSPGESEHLVAAFRRGLESYGFTEGRNLRIEFRWAEGR
ncbi:MAG: ABC transporter substrate-binding protein, partial [Alphaproteobacteria bacterium]|nr:ABC transporter substrate-binding protein [Alphaproteobacteria bacterium]